MAEITQKLGFEASSAISTLNQLNSVLKTTNTQFRALAKTSSSINGGTVVTGFNTAANAANKAKTAISNTNTAVQTFGNQGSQAVKKVDIAFGGLAKALVAREIVSAINRLRAALVDAIDTAAEFQLTVARISNIAEGPGSSVKDLTQNISDLSVQLGRPIAELSEAAFEALQNDIGTTAETFDLLAKAADNLALITGGTLTQSINAITSILKAYDKDASQAGEATDQLFAAIDKGRITLSDLESSLGKITPLANALKIPFGDVAAAMATITQSGTTAAVANTQLRAIFQKLLKPTEELQGAFQKLGVNSFQELIGRGLNLQEALEAISGAFNDNEQAIASAFGRLRAQLGVLNLLANEGDLFSASLDAVNDSAGRAAAAAENIRQTDAFQGQQAAEEFNRALRELGNELITVRTSLTRLATSVIPSLNTLTVAFKVLGTAIAGIAINAGLLGLAKYGAEIKKLIPLLTGPAGLAFAAGVAFGELIKLIGNASDSVADFAEEADQRTQNIDKKLEQNLQGATQNIENILNRRTEAYSKYLKGLETAFELETASIRQAARIADDALRNTFTSAADGLDDIMDRIEERVKNLQRNLENAVKGASSARQNLENFQFEREGRGKSDSENLQRELQRANDTADELRRALGKDLLDPKNNEAAKELSNELLKQADAARSRAESADNEFDKREGIAKADELTELALQAQVELADAKVDALEREAQFTETTLNNRKAITTEIQNQLKALADLTALLNTEGAFKTPEELTNAKDQAQDLVENINQLFKEAGADGFFEAFGEKENLEKIVKALNDGVKQGKYNFDAVQQQLAEKLQEPEYKIAVDAVLNIPDLGPLQEGLEQAVNAQGVNPIARQRGAEEFLAQSLQAQEEQNAKLQAAAAEFNSKQLQTQQNLDKALSQRQFSDGLALQETISKFQNLLQNAAKEGLNQEQVSNLQTQLQNLRQTAINQFNDGQLETSVFNSLEGAFESATQALQQKKIMVDIEANFDQQILENTKTSLSNLRTGVTGVKEEFNNTSQAAKNTGESVNGIVQPVSNVTQAVGGAIQAMNRLQEAAAQALATARAAASAGQSQYFGGRMRYRAAGGANRGADTIPTMLSPGEFVINRRSAQKFFPQLQAMNAGKSPQYREQGGTVNNIGDINVNVTSSQQISTQTGRDIAQALRRELRRNTSELRG